MSEAIQRGSTRIALRVSRGRNRTLLTDLLTGHDIVDIDEVVPNDVDLCIVDDRGVSQVETTIAKWKLDQQPTFAPVLLLSEASGTNPWEQYATLLGEQIDAIQPVPAPRTAIRARVESLLETRAFSMDLASERQLIEQIFNTSPIAKTVLDTEGNIIRANARAEDVLGLSASDLAGRAYDDPDWRIIDENGDPIPSEELPFSMVMASEEPVYGYEHGIEHPDGERVWLSVNMGPMLDDSGDIEYLVSAIEDVTERKRLERELRESEELHRVTLSNITDTVFITDQQGQFTYVCPNVHFIFGYSDEDVREMGSVEALLGKDPAPDEFAAGEAAENINLQVADAEGQDHTVLVTVKAVSIQDGERLYSVRDVTDLVESEHRLELERERLETVVSNAPLILAAIDSDGTITLSKGQQLERLGFEPGELDGESVFDVFEDAPQIIESAERVLDGEAFSSEIHIQDRTFQSWNQPVFDNGTLDHSIIVAQDITERTRQEERFQAFVEGSSDIIAVLDSEGIIEYASPSVERILGYNPEELIGENAFDIVHPEDRDDLIAAFAELSAEEDGATMAKRYRTRDAEGTWRWTETRATKRANMAQGTYVVNTRDVTQQVETERNLRRTQESRSLALSAYNAGVWELNLESDEMVWDEPTEQLFGIEPGTFDGSFEVFVDRVHPDDLPEVQAAIERSIKQNEPYHSTFRIIRDDGVERWIEARGMHASAGIGESARMLGVYVDVTEQKEREHNLRRTQRAVEASGHAIYITNPDGVIEYVNPAFEEITGYRGADAIGKTPRILNSGELPEQHFSDLWATIKSGDIWDEEVINERKDGSQYHAAQTIAPINDSDGVIEGFVAIQTDISGHKDRLQQLKVMDRVLRHNLHNDMNVVQGYGELVRQEGEDSLATYGEQIVEQSDHLLDLTDKQRKITKVLSTEPYLESIDTVSTIQRCAETILQEYPDANIDLELPKEAIASATDNLGQAVEELLINAIEHSDRESPSVRIGVTDNDESIQLQIVDTGPGIPEMDRRVVMGEHDIGPLYHGSGLGLWLVSWIIRRSNGSLRFESNEPRGTVAVITLRKPTPTSDESDVRQGDE